MDMVMAIQFDRGVDADKHYISPGGYEMTFSNGETVMFDFYEYCGEIDKSNPTILHIETRALDDDCFPESAFLRQFEGSIVAIHDLYIYTGEDDEPEINPVKLLDLHLYNDDYKEIRVDENLLGEIWKEVKTNDSNDG